MRNPIAYLKHVVKDPVNSIAEVNKRMKELIPLPIIFGVIFIIGLSLQLALELEFMIIFTLIGLAGLAFSGFLYFIAISAKKRFIVLTCDKCNILAEIKTPEDFAKYVSYNVVTDTAKFVGYDGNTKPTNGVYSLVKYVATSNATIDVQLTCPHCGEVKVLKYSASPFKCHAEAKNVSVQQFKTVSESLETSVRTAVADYNDPDKRDLIPYTYHSSKNPNFENRFTFKGVNASDAKPQYMGASLDYRKDVEEMLEHYFTINELNGSLTDPAKSKKK